MEEKCSTCDHKTLNQYRQAPCVCCKVLDERWVNSWWSHKGQMKEDVQDCDNCGWEDENEGCQCRDLCDPTGNQWKPKEEKGDERPAYMDWKMKEEDIERINKAYRDRVNQQAANVFNRAFSEQPTEQGGDNMTEMITIRVYDGNDEIFQITGEYDNNTEALMFQAGMSFYSECPETPIEDLAFRKDMFTVQPVCATEED